MLLLFCEWHRPRQEALLDASEAPFLGLLAAAEERAVTHSNMQKRGDAIWVGSVECWSLKVNHYLCMCPDVVSPGGRSRAVSNIGKVLPIPVGRQLSMWCLSCWSIAAAVISACTCHVISGFQYGIRQVPGCTWKSRRLEGRAGCVCCSCVYVSIILARLCRSKGSPAPPNLYITSSVKWFLNSRNLICIVIVSLSTELLRRIL